MMVALFSIPPLKAIEKVQWKKASANSQYCSFPCQDRAAMTPMNVHPQHCHTGFSNIDLAERHHESLDSCSLFGKK